MTPTGDSPGRFVFLFLDGVGLGPAAAGNPFVDTPTPGLEALLGERLTADASRGRRPGGVVLEALDATLGVPGLPQSATGQTTLFTGINAARHMGRHVTGLPGPRLREVLAEESLFRRAVEAGRTVTFANAFGTPDPEHYRSGGGRASATTWAVLAAGVRLRGPAELDRGEAVTWDVRGDLWAQRFGSGTGIRTPQQAGAHLAALARGHDVTLFETFYTDLAGHGRWGLQPSEAVRRCDGLIQGLLSAVDADVTVLVTSDHGNLEDPSRKSHTLHPVPLVAVGPHADRFLGARSLLDVAPRLLGGLGVAV